MIFPIPILNGEKFANVSADFDNRRLTFVRADGSVEIAGFDVKVSFGISRKS